MLRCDWRLVHAPKSAAITFPREDHDAGESSRCHDTRCHDTRRRKGVRELRWRRSASGPRSRKAVVLGIVSPRLEAFVDPVRTENRSEPLQLRASSKVFADNMSSLKAGLISSVVERID